MCRPSEITLYVVRDRSIPGEVYDPSSDAPRLFAIRGVRETTARYTWPGHYLLKRWAHTRGYATTPTEAWRVYLSTCQQEGRRLDAMTESLAQRIAAAADAWRASGRPPSTGVSTVALCPGRGDGQGHAVREDGTCAFCYTRVEV